MAFVLDRNTLTAGNLPSSIRQLTGARRAGNDDACA
jgi:hypothetical protein